MATSRSLLLIPAVLALAAVAVPSVAAQPVPLEPPIPLFSSEDEVTYLPPALATAANGGLLGVWEEDLSGTLFSRLVSPGGSPPLLGSVQKVARDAFISYQNPHLAALPSGGYVAIWHTGPPRGDAPSALPSNLLGKALVLGLDAAGRPVGEPRTLDSAPGIDVFATSAAVSPSGTPMIAWANVNGRMYVQRLSPEGAAPAGGYVYSFDNGGAPSLVARPGGGFALAWAHPEGVMIRLLNDSGAPDHLPILVDTPLTGSAVLAKAAGDTTGRIAVAWTETSALRARLLAGDGQLVDTSFTIENGAGLSLHDVSMRSDGSFLVLWSSPAQDLKARAYHADGTPDGEAFKVAAGSPGAPNPIGGDATATADGWTLAWSVPDSSDQGGTGPFLQRFTARSESCGGGLCLSGGRFRAEVSWRVPASGVNAGSEGSGTPIPLSDDTGAFWFFQPANLELTVKVLDGRAVNGHFWVFFGSLTNVEFDLMVTDTVTGEQRTYHNPAGTMGSRGDTAAF